MKHMQGKCIAGAFHKVGVGEGNAYQEYDDKIVSSKLTPLASA
jgi:hypothetical protein